MVAEIRIVLPDLTTGAYQYVGSAVALSERHFRVLHMCGVRSRRRPNHRGCDNLLCTGTPEIHREAPTRFLCALARLCIASLESWRLAAATLLTDRLPLLVADVNECVPNEDEGFLSHQHEHEQKDKEQEFTERS